MTSKERPPSFGSEYAGSQRPGSQGVEGEPDLGPTIMCTVRPNRAADAYCVWCRKPFCDRYLSTAKDGRAICHRCARTHEIDVREIGPQDVDPALDHAPHRVLWRLIFKPNEVFAQPWRGSIWPAVQFGLFASVLGLFFWNAWFWLIAEDTAQRAIDIVSERMGTPIHRDEIQRISWFIIPILAVLRLGIGSLGLHFGMRIAGAPKGTWRTHVRVFALSSAALLLCALPSSIGAFAAHIAWLMTCLAFAATRYKFSMGRSLLALLPAIILIALLPPH